jgi:DNA helicase II / ATP-dependent DNA helicase PcrA
MTEFLEQLNDPQRQAVTCTEGPVMVIAGAGSGKTRVLTYRVAYLLSQGVEPFNILALTFTNKAAREMKERIGQLVGASPAKSLWMGTFHSIFARILRSEADKLGFPSNFTIYDTDDSKRLLKNIIKEQQLDDKTYAASAVLHRISSAKNNLIGAQDYNEDFEILSQDAADRKPKIGLLYSLYQQRLRKASAMDFDDLLFNTNVLLRDFPEVLYKYQQRFRYILVDEYQDTNFSQYLIVKKLAANNENICVVGDDAQSIYAFRGANIQNILNFKKDYPDFRIFKLEQNYRSTQNIVDAANSVIAHNKDQIFKKIWTSNHQGEKILVVRAASEADEASWVGDRIFGLRMNNQLAFRDFAILYRTNAQSRSLEEALRKRNIPYRIYGGLSFYQRKEIKDMLGYFRLVINPNDEEAFRRILNFPPRGIGQTTLNKIEVAAAKSGVPMWTVALNSENYNLGIHPGITSKLSSFTLMIEAFRAQLDKLDAFELGEKIVIQSGIRRFYFEDETPENINRRENIEELLAALKDFVSTVSVETGEPEFRTLDEFMQDVALLTDADTQSENPDDTNKVSLMTIHAAKGLEFPYVFITGVEENLFPSQLSINSRQELEEERRLFYVALTRAMKQAHLTYAETRFRYGNFNFCEPSRFIDELDENFLQFVKGAGPKKPFPQKGESFASERKLYKKTTPPPAPSPEKPQPPASIPAAENGEFEILEPSQISIGMKVQHPRFGTGSIESIEGKGADTKATVIFTGTGKKQLLLKFARLRIV